MVLYCTNVRWPSLENILGKMKEIALHFGHLLANVWETSGLKMSCVLTKNSAFDPV